MNLVLIARRGELLTELAGQLTADHGVEVRCLVADLADSAFAGTLSDAVTDVDLGVLIYNAAYTPMGPFLDVSDEEITQAVNVNMYGPMRAVRALAPVMCANRRGAVVLMSSLSGLQGTPHISVYAASKAFNINLAESLWWELRSHGIDVVACCAGAMPTPGYKTNFGKKVPGMLSPEEAARQTLDGLSRGPRFVPGIVNRLGAQVMGRLVSRRAAVRLIGRNTSDMT